MSDKIYKIRFTALSPIHIGTGEDFEPTNYVIDNNEKGNPRLYEFDEGLFYRALSEEQKREFTKIVSEVNASARFKLYDFIYKNRAIAKNVAFRNIEVLSKVAEEYTRKIGKVVQREGGGKNVFNDFRISKTYTAPNTHKPVILGSSLKGSISTAYQEALLKQLRDYSEVEQLMLRPTKENLFKNFLIADATPIKQGTFVGYTVNIKRNKEPRSSDESLKPKLQAISATSEFETTIKCKESLSFEEIAKSCNDHYLPLFKSQFDFKTDEFTRKAIDESFIEKYEKWNPANNQFLLKVGKHSGARAVTVDGVRNIKIMTGKGRPPRYETEETTVWLRGGGRSDRLIPFGWLLCEVMGGDK